MAARRVLFFREFLRASIIRTAASEASVQTMIERGHERSLTRQAELRAAIAPSAAVKFQSGYYAMHDGVG